MDCSFILFQRNRSHALLVSPHDQHKMGKKFPVQTSNICQVLALSNALLQILVIAVISRFSGAYVHEVCI